MCFSEKSVPISRVLGIASSGRPAAAHGRIPFHVCVVSEKVRLFCLRPCFHSRVFNLRCTHLLVWWTKLSLNLGRALEIVSKEAMYLSHGHSLRSPSALPLICYVTAFSLSLISSPIKTANRGRHGPRQDKPAVLCTVLPLGFPFRSQLWEFCWSYYVLIK